MLQLDEQQLAPERPKSLKTKLVEYLKLAGDVAGIVLDLRDKPTVVDWASAGMRAVGIGVDWYLNNNKRHKQGVFDYFDDDDNWTIFPYEYRLLALHNATDLAVAPEWLDSNSDQPYVCLAKLGKETVGWVSNAENGVLRGPYYREDREAETYAALGAAAWESLGSRHLTYDGLHLVMDLMEPEASTMATAQMDALLSRVQLFLRAKINRSYLLTGAPGTGKSVATRWLVGVLGMSSLRVNVGALKENIEIVGALTTVLRALRPDVLILDDLDRVEVTSEVLAFLELARISCRLVIATANRPSELNGACLRPGRLDELIEFKHLDRPIVDKLLGKFAEHADEVADLPAAYIVEFANRCEVLGVEVALEGLDDLRTRAEETSEDSD